MHLQKGDGGVWNLFYNIAEKYGVVPQTVMPETAHSNNTTQMRSVLNERLRTGGYELRNLVNGKKSKKEIAEAKKAILKDVYRILSLCLGNPPSQFEWRYETADGEIKTLKTTPKEFYNMIKPENYNPESYVMIMNATIRNHTS